MTIRDSLWLWGTIVNALSKDYGFPESKATIAEGMRTFGIDQAMMCGFLPPTEDEFRAVAGSRKLLWEMSFDPGFSFERPLAPIAALHRAHPNVRGVLLDDFSTTEISHGAQPDLLARLREAMPPSLELWIVVYSMSLDIPNLREFLEHVDGVSFWVWHARELPRIGDFLARCNEMSGGKPTVLGAYLHDFGENRPLADGDMEAQLDRGVDLMRQGVCEGISLLSSSIMDVGLTSIDVTRRWIERRGSERV